MKKNNYTSIENIIKIAKRGGMFILVDDEKRENEGDLIFSIDVKLFFVIKIISNVFR